MNLASVASLASAITGLFDGAVQLGPISLSGIEAPEKLPWGGAQHVTNHKLPGGARVVDVMGRDDRDLRWSGYFLGGLSNLKARTIDAMRVAGAPVTLSWPGFQRTVIVTDFMCSSERNGYMLPYSVTCLVLTAAAPAGAPTLLGQIGADIGNALGLPTLMATLTPALQTAQSALEAVQPLVPVVGALTAGSPTFATLTGGVTSASIVVGLGLTATESSMSPLLAGAAATGTPLGTASPLSAVANLGGALSGAQSLAGLTQVAGYIGRAGANLLHAGA